MQIIKHEMKWKYCSTSSSNSSCREIGKVSAFKNSAGIITKTRASASIWVKIRVYLWKSSTTRLQSYTKELMKIIPSQKTSTGRTCNSRASWSSGTCCIGSGLCQPNWSALVSRCSLRTFASSSTSSMKISKLSYERRRHRRFTVQSPMRFWVKHESSKKSRWTNLLKRSSASRLMTIFG